MNESRIIETKKQETMVTNKYILKAMDAYPYDLEEAIENLEYALSYNSEDTTALCLMGRVRAEVFQDYEGAKEYFQEALAIDVNAKHIYVHYITTLLWNEDFSEADKFIDFALTVKGVNKCMLWFKKALLNEHQRKYKIALSFVHRAREYAFVQNELEEAKEMEERIKQKIEG